MTQPLDESYKSTSSLQLPRPVGGYPLTVNVATSSHCQPESESKKPRIDLEKMMQHKSTGTTSNNQFKKLVKCQIIDSKLNNKLSVLINVFSKI